MASFSIPKPEDPEDKPRKLSLCSLSDLRLNRRKDSMISDSDSIGTLVETVNETWISDSENSEVEDLAPESNGIVLPIVNISSVDDDNKMSSETEFDEEETDDFLGPEVTYKKDSGYGSQGLLKVGKVLYFKGI